MDEESLRELRSEALRELRSDLVALWDRFVVEHTQATAAGRTEAADAWESARIALENAICRCPNP